MTTNVQKFFKKVLHLLIHCMTKANIFIFKSNIKKSNTYNREKII